MQKIPHQYNRQLLHTEATIQKNRTLSTKREEKIRSPLTKCFIDQEQVSRTFTSTRTDAVMFGVNRESSSGVFDEESSVGLFLIVKQLYSNVEYWPTC